MRERLGQPKNKYNCRPKKQKRNAVEREKEKGEIEYTESRRH